MMQKKCSHCSFVKYTYFNRVEKNTSSFLIILGKAGSSEHKDIFTDLRKLFHILLFPLNISNAMLKKFYLIFNFISKHDGYSWFLELSVVDFRIQMLKR